MLRPGIFVLIGSLTLGAAAATPPGDRALRDETSVIQGTVTDARTRLPLERARVSLIGLPIADTTGDAGTYELAKVPPGPMRVRAERDGYVTGTATVRVEPRTVVYLDFELRQARSDTLRTSRGDYPGDYRGGDQVGSSRAARKAAAER